MKYCLFFTLLLAPVFQLITFAHSSTEAHHTFPVNSTPFPNPFTDEFAVETMDQNLKLEVFSVDGEKIPSTIYKYHHNGQIRYETGRELSRGLYLVRLLTEGETHYQKMVKIY
ncbi:MAG: T9SS type A sorting domain-containing protein [Bacteroidia bacterium]